MTLVGPYKYIVAHAENRPASYALHYGAFSLTYSELLDLTSRIASLMRKRGLRPGQLVVIDTGDRMRNLLFSLAVMHEASRCYFQNGPKLDVPIEPDIAFLGASVEGIPESKSVLVDKTFLAEIGKTRPKQPISYEVERPIVRIFQTSGTTGGPKLLAYEFETICEMTLPLLSEQPQRMYCSLPFESYGGSFFIYFALQQGLPAYLSTGNVDSDKEMMARCRVQGLATSTVTLHDLFSDDKHADMFQALELVVNLGAPINPPLVKLINSKSNCRIVNRLGSTEAGGIASREVGGNDEPGLVGNLYPGVEVVALGEDRTVLPTGVVGRLGFKTPAMRHGYLGNPEATAKHFVDGYFFSGDEGYLDESGRLFLVGRADERLNAGGVKVDPSILESELQQVEGVSDVAIFGVDIGGVRKLALALVLKPKAQLEEVKSAIKSKIGDRRVQIFIEVPKIPRNVMGKAQRNLLEAKYADRLRKQI